MRGALILLVGLGLVGGCAPGPWGVVAGVELASITVFGRGLVDMGVSAATGRDCSLVRLDRGQTYCGAPDVPPVEVVCTRTLAVVDCWAVPVAGTPVGDTPEANRAQRTYRAAPWPKTVTAGP